MKPRKPLRRVSTKRAAQLKEYKVKRDVFLTLNPMCELCGISKAMDIHHKAGRAGKLLCYTSLWMGVCRCCHDWITSNTARARERGFIVAKGHWNDQSLVK